MSLGPPRTPWMLEVECATIARCCQYHAGVSGDPRAADRCQKPTWRIQGWMSYQSGR